jgi:hypothetical protein
MTKRQVHIGEVVLDSEPQISLYADSPLPISEHGIQILKERIKVSFEIHFRPAEPELLPPHRALTIGEVIETWHCYRATVIRMIREGKLHPIEIGNECRFDRLEVISLARDVPERP